MKNLIPAIVILLTLHSSAQVPLKEGLWRAELQLNDSISLPFNFNMGFNHLEIMNAAEKIAVDELVYSGDSVFIRMPVFDSEIRCRITDNFLDGTFINHSRLNNQEIKFRAENGISWRFSENPEPTPYNILGRWQVYWENEEGENKSSVALFSQQGNHLTGTFLTSTGDYRYLEGEVSGSRISLSSFDASHAYLFNAIIQKDGSLKGDYYSGVHWHDTWTAWRNDSAELPDPESLAFLKPGYESLSFSFPDENGKYISLADAEYKNKVVIVQIMGTWCSNCLDETVYLLELYNKYPADEFKIIALDYERVPDSTRAFKNIKRLKERLKINYPVLYAGNSKADERTKTLPMLSRIAAFPTTITMDKKGKVRKIHTGFNGPATGAEYEKFKGDFAEFVETLLAE